MNVDEFGSMIRARRNQMGLTLQEVAEQVGCRLSYLSMIETGRRSPPNEELLHKLEQVLLLEANHLVEAAQWQVIPEQVKSKIEDMQARAKHAQIILDRLRSCQGNLDNMFSNGDLQRLIERHTSNLDTPEVLNYQIPIINQVAAGYPKHFTDLDYPARIADEYLTCPDISDTQAFAARIIGHSMEPNYHEGDTVVFSPEAPTLSGSDCFVRLLPDNETTFKRIYYKDIDAEIIELHPLNRAYPKREVDREQIAGMYAAIYVMRPV